MMRIMLVVLGILLWASIGYQGDAAAQPGGAPPPVAPMLADGTPVPPQRAQVFLLLSVGMDGPAPDECTGIKSPIFIQVLEKEKGDAPVYRVRITNLFSNTSSIGSWIITNPAWLRREPPGTCPSSGGPTPVRDNRANAATPIASVSYGVGGSPAWAASGDFNGDGIDDAAVANQASNNVSILLGKADGTYQAAVNYPAGNQPNVVEAGDFTGDGKLDLAVAGFGHVSLLVGNGNGSFQAPTQVAGSTPRYLAPGDFNGDGKADLAVTTTLNTVVVLLGQGNGTFMPGVSYPVGQQPREIRSGDFNSDGKADLATVNTGSGTVSVLLGLGNGTFQAATHFPAGRTPWALAVTDLNQDGKLDLAISSDTAGTVTILLGTGTGAFGAAMEYAAGNRPGSIAVGDLEGDSRPEVAITNGADNSYTILTTTSAGALVAPRLYRTSTQSSGGPSDVVLGDFNGDGRPDIVAINTGSDSGVDVLLANAAGGFGAPTRFAAGRFLGVGVAGDFNNDGKLDLAATDQFPRGVSLLLGNGNGALQAPTTFPISAPGANLDLVAVAAADLNGDGFLDIVTANQDAGSVSGTTQDVAVLLGSGTGTFQAAVTYDTPLAANAIAIGDVTGDSKLDLIITSSDPFDGFPFNAPNYVSVLAGNGNGTFQPAVSHLAGKGAHGAALGDFNQDGKLDVAVANFEAITTLLNTGVGGFTPVTSATPEFFIAADLTVLDANFDGRLDLAATADGNIVYVFPGFGNGAFAEATPFRVGANPIGLSAGDLTGDGKPDLAVAALGPGGITVLVNTTGDATPTPLPTRTPTVTPTRTPTPTAAAVSGRGFTLQSGSVGPAGVRPQQGSIPRLLTWRPGAQTSTLPVRWSPEGGFVFLGDLPPLATSLTDTQPLADPTYCYTVFAYQGTLAAPEIRGIGDLLCLYPNTATGTGPAQYQVRLNESSTVELAWMGPGAQDRYELRITRFSGPNPTPVPLTADRTSYTAPNGPDAACYRLVAFQGATELGGTDILCAVPGIASFPTTSLRLEQALERARSRP